MFSKPAYYITGAGFFYCNCSLYFGEITCRPHYFSCNFFRCFGVVAISVVYDVCTRIDSSRFLWVQVNSIRFVWTRMDSRRN